VQITFWGAAGTVTGSRHLVDLDGRRLLVDCGMFQGLKSLRLRNWEPFPVDPASIDAVLLTHAHIDHTGWLPGLVRDGFGGPIWCSPGTDELCRILLPDAAHIQEEDARFANKRRSSRHDPALPLYTAADAKRALRLLRPHPFGDPFEPVGGVDCQYTPVGHILGAASLRIRDATTSVLFTGDVGRPVDPVMRPPAAPLPADHVVTESTYGNRVHAAGDPLDDLAEIVNRTVRRGGSLLVPVFAVGRAQTVLHLLSRLRAAGRMPALPVYLDSPMAVNTTELFCRYLDEHRLTEVECREMCDGVEFVRTVEESKRLASLRGPMVLLSASGMLTAGRVLHHLERLAPDHRNTVLLVGYQAAGTRGEALAAGSRSIKLFGEYVPVRCEIARIDGLSAHADADELCNWLADLPVPALGASIVHGEPAAADAMRWRLRDQLGWEPQVPDHGDTIEFP
jgi:metallo-beta-lactamase family protein